MQKLLIILLQSSTWLGIYCSELKYFKNSLADYKYLIITSYYRTIAVFDVIKLNLLIINIA